MYYSLRNWLVDTASAWGSGEYGGQRVSKGHILRDGDIVGFHI